MTTLQTILHLPVPLKSQRTVEDISSALIPPPTRHQLPLGRLARIFGLPICSALIRKFIANAVRDDVRVQRLLLDGEDLRVCGLEGEFGLWTVGEALDAI